jgi:hypothetical protein
MFGTSIPSPLDSPRAFFAYLASAAFLFALAQTVNGVVGANIRSLAQERGWDKFLGRFVNWFADWESTKSRWRLWLLLGFSGGIAAALWIGAMFPPPPSLDDISKAIAPIQKERDEDKAALEEIQGGPKSPFLGLDDAKRWRWAESLFRASVGNSNSRKTACHARVWGKPDSKTSAAFWNEIMYVFYLGDWGLEGGRNQKGYFPDGVTVSSGASSGEAYNCGYRLSEWLKGIGVGNVEFHANQSTPDLTECNNECIELVIGDIAMKQGAH